MVPGKTDITLNDVTFAATNSEWMSPPVRFSGAASSYGEVIKVDDVKFDGSVAFMATVYREVTGDFSFMEWYAGSGFLGHVWVFKNKLLARLCGQHRSYSTTFPNNQWTTVAMSYDYDTNVLSMWVNGEVETHPGLCSTQPSMSSATVTYVNHW